MTDSIDDEQRLRNALGDAGAEVRPLPRHLIERLPGVLRECNFAVTVTALDDDAISVEPGDTRDRFLGAAVDVGTTTVAVSLHDLRTGAELGRRGMANKQITCGADVISRMSYAAETGNGAGILQRMILETIQTAIDELCAESGVSARDIYHIAAVGNSVMQTLLLGIDPGPIAGFALHRLQYAFLGWSRKRNRLQSPPECRVDNRAVDRQLRGWRHCGRHTGKRNIRTR